VIARRRRYVIAFLLSDWQSRVTFGLPIGHEFGRLEGMGGG
jgi:hypothetical protein